jgi:hypothetical protein
LRGKVFRDLSFLIVNISVAGMKELQTAVIAEVGFAAELGFL